MPSTQLPIHIREAKISDIDEIIKLTIEHTTQNIENAFYQALKDRLLKKINTGLHVLVAADHLDGHIYAFLSISNNPSDTDSINLKGAYITNLYVKSSLRRNGLGSKLINEAILFLLKNNFSCLRASHTACNRTAKHFFNKVGFQKIKNDVNNTYESLNDRFEINHILKIKD